MHDFIAHRISIENFKDKLGKMCWITKWKKLLIYFLKFLKIQTKLPKLTFWWNVQSCTD